MITKINLDTGLITLFLMENPPEKVVKLFTNIKSEKIKAFIVPPILTEVYKHLCVANGKIFAQNGVIIILERYPIILVEMTKSLIIKAGELKYQYRNELSYVDCFLLACGMLNKLEIHTTEKEFPSIPNLKIVKYQF